MVAVVWLWCDCAQQNHIKDFDSRLSVRFVSPGAELSLCCFEKDISRSADQVKC